MISSGTEQLPLAAIASRNILVTTVKGVHAIPVSEYVMGMVLYFAKNIQRYQRLKSKMAWDSFSPVEELNGKIIGILGTGKIGAKVAIKARSFGMIPIGLNSRGDPVEPFQKIYSIEQLSEMLPLCDYICSSR